MSKPGPPPPPGFVPPDAPPTYNQAMGGGPGVSPQAPYQPQAPVGPQQAYVPVVTTVVPPGPTTTHMVCPHCHAEIDTTVKTSPSTMAWISGLLIALFGCWMGCCLIPCCMDECMDKEHYCPNCQAFLGSYRR